LKTKPIKALERLIKDDKKDCFMAHIFKGDFSKLDNPVRREEFPPKELLLELGLKEGMRVIDFGAGIGYFSIPAAEIVGDKGKVIAIDIKDRMVEELKKKSARFKNLEIVKSNKMPKLSADIILAMMVLHEVPDAKAFLRNAYLKLNKGGKLIVLDWEKKETEKGPPVDHRISKEEAIGFLNAEYKEYDKSDELYLLEFRKE
jgi:ubiquinone/menaquinone biosynthesis C-methylase UbiE